MEQSARNISNSVVAVIGGAGFLGSHLVDYLITEKNCKVIVLDNLITGQKRFVHPAATFEWCDITHSEQQLIRLFEHYGVQYVFNYAAEPYIPTSFDRPLHVFDINAKGALTVLNAADIAGVKAILQVSSAEIYGDSVKGKLNEEAVVNPHSTYGASKAVIDSLVQVRWKEAKVPAIALRQFNCVGERETHPYIIPEIIKQISTGVRTGDMEINVETNEQKMTYRPLEVLLGNNSSRDFQYAGDAVAMAVELLEKGSFGEVYNMGSEDTIKMYDLAVKIGELMQIPVMVVPDSARVRPWEIWHLQSDNTKLYSVIQYRPKVALEEALLKTINWFRSNGDKWDF